MFRLTHYLKEVRDPKPLGPHRQPPGPVVMGAQGLGIADFFQVMGETKHPGLPQAPNRMPVFFRMRVE